MTHRLRLLWCAATLGTLVALSAVPGAPQDQGTETAPAPQERPAGTPRTGRTRRGYTAGQRPAVRTPPLPAPNAPAQPGAVPGPGLPPEARAGAAPQNPSSPTAPPNRLSVVQGRGGGKDVWMEVYDLDLDHLLRLLSSEAGVTITKTEAVKGKVTIIAPEAVPLDVAFQILDSVLQMRGYAMIRDGSGIYKIMPMNEAAQAGLQVNFGANPEEIPDTCQLITQVVQLRNLSADEVAQDISSLLSSGLGGGGGPQGGGAFTARLVPTTTNALIITDTAANIKRVLTIIADMEQQLSGGYKVYRLQYYDASTMADVINSLILGRGAGGAVPIAGRRQPWEQRVAQPGRPGAPGPQRQPVPQQAAGASVAGSEFVFPDTKTNSLVIQATPIHLQLISELVDQLDRPVSLRDSFVVYPVQNLTASDLAQRVGQHLGITVNVSQAGGTATPGGAAGRGAGAGRGGAGYGSYGSRTGSPYRSGTSNAPFNTPGGTNLYRGQGLPRDSSSGETRSSLEVEPLAAPSTRVADPMQIAQAPEGAMPVPAAPPAPVVAGPGAEIGGGDEGVVSPSGSGSQAVITADDNTNTILVTAPPEQADLIRAMLEKLDVVPPQVYIQAIICEVILSNDQSLGFEWSNLMATLNHNGEQFQGVFDSNFGLGQRDDNGNLLRTVGTGLSGFITGPENFAALLTALAQSQNVRVLSTPSIFTSNNEPGNITVANRIPFPTTTLTSTAGTGTGVSPVIQTGVDYQVVGIVLDVTPRITQGDIVALDVTVSANDVGDPINVGGQSFPTTRDREAGAILSIKDGYTVVLGGLMRDSVSRTSSKVPILGEIPLLGALFRSSHTHVDKTELLVFLTPRIVRTAGEAARVTDEEKCKLQEIPKTLQAPSAPLQVPSAPLPVPPSPLPQ